MKLFCCDKSYNLQGSVGWVAGYDSNEDIYENTMLLCCKLNVPNRLQCFRESVGHSMSRGSRIFGISNEFVSTFHQHSPLMRHFKVIGFVCIVRKYLVAIVSLGLPTALIMMRL